MLTIYRAGEGLFLETRSKDGGSYEVELVQEGYRLTEKGWATGEFYILRSDGQLKFGNEQAGTLLEFKRIR